MWSYRLPKFEVIQGVTPERLSLLVECVYKNWFMSIQPFLSLLDPKIEFVFYIQGLPSLNVGILPSCRGPQIKKNSVKIFCKICCNILKFF